MTTTAWRGMVVWLLMGGVAALSAPAAAATTQEVQARLNSTEWTVELSPLSSAKGSKPTKDVLRFGHGKVASEQLGKAGFSETNFTVTVGDDGVAVWETMQTAEDTSVVFWRGELHGDTMRGMLSKHPAKGENVDLAFSAAPMKASAPPAAAPPVVEAPSTPAPETAAPAVETTKADRKAKRR